MNNSFVELYLDEDVSILIAELLRARGFSATTTLESGNLANSDLEQLEFASEMNKAILTHNRVDFERLAVSYFESGKTHAGIIIAVRRIPQDIVNKLLRILGNRSADEMKNQTIYI